MLPVIAAGGIMDGAGIAALGLGAIAAQLGTAFVVCRVLTRHIERRCMRPQKQGTSTASARNGPGAPLARAMPAAKLISTLVRELEIKHCCS